MAAEYLLQVLECRYLIKQTVNGFLRFNLLPKAADFVLLRVKFVAYVRQF